MLYQTALGLQPNPWASQHLVILSRDCTVHIYIYVYTVQYIVCVCVCVYASDPTVKQPTEKTPRTLDDVSMNAPRRAWPNNLNPTEVDG